MKTRIELSCTEENLNTAIFEVQKIVAATDLISVEVKVFHDRNRITAGGHSWLTFTNKSNPHEVLQIYELKKKISDLMDQLEKKTNP